MEKEKNKKEENKIVEKEEKDTKKVKIEKPETSIGIEISADAVASIVSVELNKIKGIDRQGIYLQIYQKHFGQRQNTTKGIKVDIAGKDVMIDINIMVYYGIRIPDIAFDIQSQVKKSVEAMTGLNVREVNVHVQGVKIEEEK